MKLFFAFVLTIWTFSSLNSVDGQSCNCPANYQPFCGTDEVTYSNRCALDCARSRVRGLQVKFEGVCAVPANNAGGGAGGGRRPAGGRGNGDLIGSGSENRPQVVRPPGGHGRPFQPRPDPIVCSETRNGKAFRVQCKNQRYV